MKNQIDRNPREVSLRLIYSTILKDSFSHNFKAVFELLNCKALSPGLRQKFEIFRMLTEIEKNFFNQTQRESGKM